MRQPDCKQEAAHVHTACGDDEEEEVVMLGKVWSAPTSGIMDSQQARLAPGTDRD